jgi:hypothetical protein
VCVCVCGTVASSRQLRELSTATCCRSVLSTVVVVVVVAGFLLQGRWALGKLICLMLSHCAIYQQKRTELSFRVNVCLPRG